MGGGTTTTSQSTSSTQLPQWVQDAGQSNYGVAQSIASAPNPYYTGPTTVTSNDDTSNAKAQLYDNMYSTNTNFNLLNSDLGNYDPSSVITGTNPSVTPTTATATGYNPSLYTARGYDPSTYSAQNYTAQGYTGQGYTASTAAAPGLITAGQLGNTDLTPYMNPYIQNVVDKSMAQLQQNHDITANSNAAAATAAGAFGGSRAAVQQGVADAQTAQNAGLLSSQLYSAGYDNAQSAATADINRRLQADTTNVGNKIGVDEFNAGATNAASAFTANAKNTADEFTANANNTANQFNANANNTAASQNTAALNQAGLFDASAYNSAASQNASATNAASQFGAGSANAASLANAAAANSVGEFNASNQLSQQEALNQAIQGQYGLRLNGANAGNSAGLANATTLGQFGAAQTSLDQSALSGQIAQYNQNAAYPQQQLGLLESALGMTPYDTTTTSSGTVDKSQSPDFASIGMGMMKMFNPFSAFM